MAGNKRKGMDGTVVLPVEGWHVEPLPGLPAAEVGHGFIKASDLPDLSAFTKINPRAPKPGGAVPKAIRHTLTTAPGQFALKNAGLYLLVESMEKGEKLMAELSDPKRHGLVNGGHTMATILDVQQNGTVEEKNQLPKAHVPIHVYSGIPDNLIVEMASGLNFTRQVQEASLEHLRGHYDGIKAAMKGVKGEEEIAYFEGDKGTVNVKEIVTYVEMFNLDRYPLTDEPYQLYAHVGRVVHEASEDFALRPEAMDLVISKLPDILKLRDLIMATIQPMRAKLEPERRGRGRPSLKEKPAKEKKPHITLPFSGDKVFQKLVTGWLFPILSGFRANVKWDLAEKKFSWKRSNATILEACAKELVNICIQEQRAAHGKPEWVGKRESAYRQCKMLVDLTIQKLNDK